ncbi:single stranded DNA-binding protein [Arcicella aurantiaca]|uniref:Single-stranded DNA-binding protein n=1 Tax=Arcicella aurantiaca TaxID=591202 RepID=A0A316DDR4_9BACT|nr:single-stranded DNA-binding protein [Arcicella aurantiaca]PWK16115.1 single stranded DNA-binding protein [Arcicella aurantiaca]
MINQVVFEGNLGADSISVITEESAVTKFNIANTVKYKTKAGEEKEQTTWVKCEGWGLPKWMVEKLLKGVRVIVTGSLKENVYEKDDKTIRSLFITTDTINFLETKKAE